MAEAKRDQNRVPTLLGVSSADESTPTPVVVDPTTKRLKVDGISEESGHSAVGDGTITITTAGTRVQLPDQSCSRVYIEAHEDNTGVVVVGGSTVVAAKSGRRGRALFPTQGEWFKVTNLNLLYVDAVNSGDKITYYYEV